MATGTTSPPAPVDPRRVRQAFERRAARAAALAPGSTAEAPLAFAAGLFRAQGSVAERLVAEGSLSGRLGDDLSRLRPGIAAIVAHVEAAGPPGLVAAARAGTSTPEGWDDPLLEWWRGRRSGADDFLARALLRPYVEALAALGVTPEPGTPAAAACDFCGGLPWIASRRPMVAGDAAQRYLGCALCGKEQVVGRSACPVCAEDQPDKLPIFQTERYPAARIEACARCRHYVKSIDLTVDGRAVPEVDDLASVAIDLWAAEEGYARVEPGLAGL